MPIVFPLRKWPRGLADAVAVAFEFLPLVRRHRVPVLQKGEVFQ